MRFDIPKTDVFSGRMLLKTDQLIVSYHRVISKIITVDGGDFSIDWKKYMFFYDENVFTLIKLYRFIQPYGSLRNAQGWPKSNFL